MTIPASDATAAGIVLIGIGALLTGLGVFFWGVRHLLFARRDVENVRSGQGVTRSSVA